MNKQKILKSKILIPDIREDYEKREKLLSGLQKEEGKLIVLHAGIGYGKTVLMSQFVRLPGHVCAWYHLDSLDNEPETFIRYLILSLDRALGDFGFEGERYLKEALVFDDRLIRNLVIDLKEFLERMEGLKLVLALDDLQELKNPRIYKLLEEFLEHIGDRFLLMAAVKGAMPDSLTKYFLRNEGTLIGAERLSFREAEIRSILGRMLPEATQGYGEMIWKKTEGWPAGVMFAALYLCRPGSSAPDVEWKQIRQESWMQNYITYELYSELSCELQRFLLATSFVEELQPELCNDICGINYAGDVLQRLLRENIFLFPIAGKSGSYRYHPIFRSFLMEKADEELKRIVLKKATAFYLMRLDVDTAVRYAVRAGDPGLLLTILERHGLSLIGEGKREPVAGCLRYLEESSIQLPPQVCLVGAVNAFWECNYEKTNEMITLACRQSSAYTGYRYLFRGLSMLGGHCDESGSAVGQKTGSREGSALVLEGLRQLEREKRELPPLPEDAVVRIHQLGEEPQQLLQISCFGKFRVVIKRNGREISWRTRKAVELFAYLADLEGKPAERGELLEQLWPGNAPDNAVAMLHNMIYNIRKELSSQPELANLIQYKGHKYSLDISRVTTDLDSKKRICRLAEMERVEELYDQREELLSYWGVYLQEVEGTWCMARRAYFERMYGKACRILAEYCRTQGDYETEASCWSAYMAADRYSEEAVAGLLGCYARTGERNQMKRIFESAGKIFREELGLELSPDTVKLYERIMGKGEAGGEG